MYSLPSNQATTSEACKQLYNQNLDNKKTIKNIGGIRKYCTILRLSIEFVMEQATGGNNFVHIVGHDSTPTFNLGRLGGKYAIGFFYTK